MNPFSLAGQTALVTGANTGIGQAIAVAMGRAGAHVICAGRSNCDETVGMLDSGESLSLNFADPMAARDIFADRQVDILVNNAGIIRRDDSVDFTESDWVDVMDVNRDTAILERIPAGRWGQADDIGQTAVFLSSPAANYILGSVLNIDGGWLAR